MSKIDQKLVLAATFGLKKNSNNKIWGLISLFIATKNDKKIEGNLTYVTKSDTLSEILQNLFYFGNSPKSFSSNNQLYFRLSSNWEASILDYIPIIKPKILDAAIFYYKTKDFNNGVSSEELVNDFINELNIPKVVLQSVFDLTYTAEIINLTASYPKKDILTDFKTKFSLNNQNDTLSFDSPYSVTSHPSEFKRAPFIQTLYSGSKIQELILLTDFDLDEFYPKSERQHSQIELSSANKIFYGAPGTGKSHKVKELLKGKKDRTERVTFHPEYDYASFIGGFKPITEKDEVTEKEEIKYKFVPQIFTNIYIDAWNNKDNEYYLVIEEINRGNCAEIFGDIFQLLDRNSDDDITPSHELKEYLVKELTSEDGIKGIANGKMNLPPNLNILATMNTSDQSLFPMDSAFKRRWDWEYIPINYEKSPENPSSDFQVNISETESFSWLDFIEKVNTVIKENPNLGMDKCIGNYFIKAKDNIITLEEFINKAIFYLWNDVFKDEDDHIFEENTFYEDFFPIATKGKEKVLKILVKIGLNTPEKGD